MTDNYKIVLLLNGDSCFDEKKKNPVVQSSIKYIKTNERLSGPLFE